MAEGRSSTHVLYVIASAHCRASVKRKLSQDRNRPETGSKLNMEATCSFQTFSDFRQTPIRQTQNLVNIFKRICAFIEQAHCAFSERGEQERTK
jgi:hypothetical protein